MPQTPNTRSGGQVLADALYAHGVELAYCVAGESYLELLDALYDYRDRIRLVTCRQEGGAANMAEAYGKLTGKPGVVMVTRGPGACHAAIGCHTAFQDSTPMVMLVGQVARDQMDREAFQEIDYRRMFGQVAKWVAQIETADRIPEYLARAFHTATSGRPGPVVLALPEDMLRDHVAVADAARYQTVRANPGPADLETLRGMLAEAERPLMLVGGGGWSDAAAADIVAFAEANDIPTLCSFRRLDIFDNNHKNFCGDLSTGSNPKIIEAFKSSDLLVVVGARLGEITTQGYTLMSIPDTGRRLVHVHADSDELGRVFQPTLAIQSGMAQFAGAAQRLDRGPPRRLRGVDDHSGIWRHSGSRRLHEGGAQAPRGRWRRRHRRCRQLFRLADALPEIRPQGALRRSDEWGDGLLGPRRLFGRTHLQGQARPGLRRRRRLHDGTVGAGDRRPVRREADHAGLQQRHVRHHPRTSGAAPSRTPDRH
jgi:thiamine pyrophosphate-dependent acetolactate synthase large subunit-like protein